jgi:hypothetical protein
LLTAAGVAGLAAVAVPGGVQAKPGGSGGAKRLSTPPDAIVETRAGKLRGAVRDGVYTFTGVPYGTDAGGAARFLPAQPFPAWKGVRTALTYGPCCPQVVRGGWKNDETAFIYDWDDGYPGEGCLRLNIWSPGLSGKPRPVMFWIHGGGREGEGRDAQGAAREDQPGLAAGGGRRRHPRVDLGRGRAGAFRQGSDDHRLEPQRTVAPPRQSRT